MTAWEWGAGGREEAAHPSSSLAVRGLRGKPESPRGGRGEAAEEEAAGVWGLPVTGREVQGAGKDLQSRWEMRTGGAARTSRVPEGVTW